MTSTTVSRLFGAGLLAATLAVTAACGGGAADPADSDAGRAAGEDALPASTAAGPALPGQRVLSRAR
ncbi:hypothetical protein ACN27F_24505 [Solwaraspora sp. WMMB335]|uniref:hypothetical protein n=1 Tax=Solwaraspora sp. WMMB335 TaxID=3404118 RepID=UPI003B92B858